MSTARASRIKYLAQHDYSGDADGVLARAAALHTKYGRQLWLTEFSVGSGKDRATNNAFATKILPMLDAAESVARYAWYSTRNAPGTWVNESNLLPVEDAAWAKFSGQTCGPGEMTWLSQHQSLEACQVRTLDAVGCSSPKTAIYQSGDVQNCCESEPQHKPGPAQLSPPPCNSPALRSLTPGCSQPRLLG